MTEYARSAEEEALNDSIKDTYVLAVTAKQGRLNVKAADELAGRLRSHADRMIDDGDREMLRTAADGFERVSLRIKAGAGAASRAKASNGSRTGSRQAPIDYLALSHAQDLERMASAGPFCVNGHEESERRRAEVANAMLAEQRRRHEEQRRAQVEATRRPKGPGR